MDHWEGCVVRTQSPDVDVGMFSRARGPLPRMELTPTCVRLGSSWGGALNAALVGPHARKSAVHLHSHCLHHRSEFEASSTMSLALHVVERGPGKRGGRAAFDTVPGWR
jgi:hypothetical protein